MPLSRPFGAHTFKAPHKSAGLIDLILRPAVEADFDCWRTRWRPKLEEMGDSSAAWPWESEIAAGASNLGRLCLSLASGDGVEGMISLRVAHLESRSPPGFDLLYVEYVSTAPWNFPEPDGPRLIGGMGTIMVATAIQLAKDDQALRGRIGLHSKPKAEPWYRDYWRFTDCGSQPTSDGPMVYFEGEPGKYRWPAGGASK